MLESHMAGEHLWSAKSSSSPIFLYMISFQFSSFQSLSCVQLFATPWIAARQASLSITTPRACSNSCPSPQWCHPTISSSVIPFSSHLQFFPASGSFPVSQFFASSSQSIGVSASASVLPVNIQDWFPVVSTGCKNNTQLWIWRVMEIKFNAVKSDIP